MRLLFAVMLLGCSSTPSADPAARQGPPDPAKPAPIANRTPPDAAVAGDAPLAKLDPILIEPASGRSCALRWDELRGAAPPTIDLVPASSKLTDDCPEGFDPVSNICAEGAGCVHATMRGGEEATLSIRGPEGSGRFNAVGLSIGGKRFACITASTVGWRLIAESGDKLAPLKWLEDVDGDKDAELVIWTRLPWGDSEVANALMPVVYVLDGDRLVRRDDRAKALRVKVAGVYHGLVNLAPDGEKKACFVALTAALGS
ncbi:MAG TPA: hypothetical protein VMZ53_13575 [Kofleriaceae bacterium]|nr:hypothetical protein [Kofleriaceae bacterium]